MKSQMRNSITVAAVCLFAVAAVAQKSNVVSAYGYMNKQQWAKAIEVIEPATTNETSKSMAKTWWYRGQIYHGVASSQEADVKALAPNPLGTAIDSYIKVFSLDMRKINEKDVVQRLRHAGNMSLNNGVSLYNEKNYDGAVEAFMGAVKVADHFKTIDTLALYNVGLSAERAGKTDLAIEYYQKCIEHKYKGAQLYWFLANLHKENGNAEMHAQVLSDGIAAYPNDQGLLTERINLYLKNNDAEGALASLNKAIENAPDNKTLYFARGVLYDNTKQYDKVEADYQKAIDLDANYFDAQYNMGAFFYNQGVEKHNEGNALPTSDKAGYDKAMADADALFKKSISYLEAAEKLQPEDKNTLNSLKQLYIRIKDNDNYNRVKEKLGN